LVIELPMSRVVTETELPSIHHINSHSVSKLKFDIGHHEVKGLVHGRDPQEGAMFFELGLCICVVVVVCGSA
jgi:hypothetical protein